LELLHLALELEGQLSPMVPIVAELLHELPEHSHFGSPWGSLGEGGFFVPVPVAELFQDVTLGLPRRKSLRLKLGHATQGGQNAVPDKDFPPLASVEIPAQDWRE